MQHMDIILAGSDFCSLCFMWFVYMRMSPFLGKKLQTTRTVPIKNRCPSCVCASELNSCINGCMQQVLFHLYFAREEKKNCPLQMTYLNYFKREVSHSSGSALVKGNARADLFMHSLCGALQNPFYIFKDLFFPNSIFLFFLIKQIHLSFCKTKCLTL